MIRASLHLPRKSNYSSAHRWFRFFDRVVFSARIFIDEDVEDAALNVAKRLRLELVRALALVWARAYVGLALYIRPQHGHKFSLSL